MTDQLDTFFDIFARNAVEQFARASGFIKRLRKISGLDFLTQLTYGLVGLKHPSLGGMVGVVDARFTREALHYRFNESAVAFLKKCLNHALQHRLALVPISTALLDAYRRILIVDSSSWDVSPKLQQLLPGSGGGASPANCKVQVGYEYKGGELSFFEMTPGNLPDNRYTDNLGAHVKARDLLLIDLGYFKLTTFSAIHEKKAFFLSRFLIGTSVFTQHAYLPLDLEIVLTNATKNSFELDVVLGEPGKMEIPCRLICQRVDPAVANRRRARLRKQAKKKGRTPSQLHLKLADWTLLITNAPASQLPASDAWLLYSLRWQIELLFKQLKSVLKIDHANTSNICRLRCEVIGRMIVAVLITRLHAVLNSQLWNTKHKEISFEKLYKRIQERALSIAKLLLNSAKRALEYLKGEAQNLLRDCAKSSYPARRTTLEKIERAGNRI